MPPIKLSTFVASAVLALAALPAVAHTTVTDAWVRGTVAQQGASGAFMHIRNTHGARLVAVESSAAGVVQIHQMAMQGDTMRMHAVPGLDLPKDQEVELKPGGYHIMLMDLKARLKPGDTVELTLVVEGQDGKRERVTVKAPVRPLGSVAPAR